MLALVPLTVDIWGHVIKIPDFINGSFETLGGVTTFLNCWRLYKDKEVKGVVWQLTIFYTAWGLWNMYYYPYLNQWLSFAGGLVIVTGNILWIMQVIWYLKHPPKGKIKSQASS